MGTNANVKSVERVVVRLAGDSGDGMQLTGNELTRASALAGNDVATFPDYPAEIRAPAGTLAGVSGFQLHFASQDIFTPGDEPDVLVAMNPAAFKKNIGDLKPGGLAIVNQSAFIKNNLRKVGYDESPLEDPVLNERFRIVPIEMNAQVERALENEGLSTKEIGRSKNFWALGLLYWLYGRNADKQLKWIDEKFANKKKFAESNKKVFLAGHAFGETAELFGESYRVEAATTDPGHYRNIMGNQALVTGLVAAAQKSGLEMVLGSYPITPASDILHAMSRFRHYGCSTVQAEDEIAAIGVAIGASYGGAIGVCSTSGPGLALKGEALGLAHIVELPLVVVNVQRGGPSTGLPTKTEQSDLLQALFGRNGDAPLPVLAAKSPADCFDAAYEAVRIATKYMTPVILMSDGYVANGSEPWRLPDLQKLKAIEVNVRVEPEGYEVYQRDETTLARDWVIPGTPGMEHRVGGLEKDSLSGEVSYVPENHAEMCRVRAEKVRGVQAEIDAPELYGDLDGDTLIVGWGGTFGALRQACDDANEEGLGVAHCHLRWIHPFAPQLDAILKRYRNVLVCELNSGQLAFLLRATFLKDVKSFTKVEGQPFRIREVLAEIQKLQGSSNA